MKHDCNPERENPYHVLSLPNFASEVQIKKRYRQLVLVLHPDKRRRSSRRLSFSEQSKLDLKFHLVQEAKTFLLSAEFREEKLEYDKKLKIELRLAQTARRNSANKAFFSLNSLSAPFANGEFRWVSKGTYIEGRRKDQLCVCKWFKSGTVFEDKFFSLDMKAIDKALEIIKSWNRQGFIEKLVQINIPEVWTFETSANATWAGAKVLQEPFIENYQKFNSNTGWASDKAPWARVMQALSHYSYHVTNGRYLLCDLQGGISDDGIILTDPVILSQSRQYGVTDLGKNGINSFFCNHKCNEFCHANWKKPNGLLTRHFQPKRGTAMIYSRGSSFVTSPTN
jgi:curved DNA-binding protein CbpA